VGGLVYTMKPRRADCLIYAEADAKWDLKPVAAK
jgi:hypothetical protein